MALWALVGAALGAKMLAGAAKEHQERVQEATDLIMSECDHDYDRAMARIESELENFRQLRDKAKQAKDKIAAGGHTDQILVLTSVRDRLKIERIKDEQKY